MKKNFAFKAVAAALMLALCPMVTSCADHDDPELTPINTSEVKISAKVDVQPSWPWLNPTEEITIRVSGVEMSAPKGVVLRSISLYADGQKLMDKPYSGEPLEYKVPLTYTSGRLNFSVIGNLIRKDHRDAQILIEDNIQRIVFSETPKLECKAHINVNVKSVSTTGQEYSQNFDVESDDGGIVFIPDDKLFWNPTSGSASTIELTLTGSAETWSPNSTLESDVRTISWGSKYPTGAVLKLTIANSPGSLDKEKLGMYVSAIYYGTTENITVTPQPLNILFDLRESQN